MSELVTEVRSALTGCTTAVGADQACTDLAAATCTKLDACVFNGTAIRYGGASTCRSRQKQSCLLRLGATGTGNSPADVEQCTGALPAATCTDFDLNDVPECEAKIGAGANDTVCTFPGQCQSSACAIAQGTNCGTCAAASQPGDSCAEVACSHGFICVAATQQCQPIGSTGQTCDTDHPCGARLTCVVPAETGSGTCEESGTTIGAHCDPKHQTAPGCTATTGLYCSGTDDTCKALAYATAGAPCGSVNGEAVECTNASTCFGAHGTTPGLCIADAADGMPCDTEAGPSCLAPANCVTGNASATSGTCRVPDPTRCS